MANISATYLLSIIMKDFIIVTTVAISFIFILGYVVHMFLGGLVEPATEKITIAVVCTIGIIVVVFLGLDIIKQRRKR